MDGWKDGWVDGWTDGRTDGWMEIMYIYMCVCVCVCTYLLTAVGLTPDGNSTVHIYTQTIRRTSQLHWICPLSDYSICTTVWKRRLDNWPSPFSDTNEKAIFSFGRIWEVDRNQWVSKSVSVFTFVRSFNQMRFLDTHSYWRLLAN